MFVGTAGWAIPKTSADQVPTAGSGLARYATIFNCAEVNSTFKHDHRAGTFARWAETVPDSFRFSVKLPKAITHDRRLVGCAEDIRAFLGAIAPLGDRLGPLLVQLPPSLAFDAQIAAGFFAERFHAQAPGRIVSEPRHPSWFAPEADELLSSLEVARTAADPAVVPAAAVPGGFTGFSYIRLHGSPRTYYSSYDQPALDRVAALLHNAATDAWCIFDNTASGAGFGDALRLRQLLGSAGQTPPIR